MFQASSDIFIIQTVTCSGFFSEASKATDRFWADIFSQKVENSPNFT